MCLALVLIGRRASWHPFVIGAWHGIFAAGVWPGVVLLSGTMPAFAFRAFNWVLAWFDRPAQADPEAQRLLSGLHVTVAVPAYNEDPALLDRCLYALVNQTRPPQLIWVVDDGSTENYTALREYWVRPWPTGTRIRWSHQHNQGKRRAHSVVFGGIPEADIFVTVDSDTTLDLRALEEGLKPFQDQKVMSVAGIELGFNSFTNFLTRMQWSLAATAQAVIGAAWSVAGDMYTNRGPFALYRAEMIRKILPAYRDEFFLGRRITLGDDSLLALCASHYGKSVQQLTAFGLTMWPENLSHHLRQRVRWARGRTIRNFWRIRYRPISSYCFWFTVTSLSPFLQPVLALGILIAWWPLTEPSIGRLILIGEILSVPNALRALCFRRSDETLADRILLLAIRPLASAWGLIVLSRAVRLWGTITFLRQGWTTRQEGPELVMQKTELKEALT